MGYSHGNYWTEEKIKSAVFEVVEKLKLDRMPSKPEIEKYYGDYALTGKLKDSGGMYHYAKLYGLPIKESDTYFGIQYEQLANDILTKKGYDAELTSVLFPYDILVNKRVKIDVKVGRTLNSGNINYYKFRFGKAKQTCDVYVAIALNTDESINKIYIIPASAVSGKTQLTIGYKTSKYDRYIDRWDYIKTIDNIFKSIETS